jgi:hypothetical protein
MSNPQAATHAAPTAASATVQPSPFVEPAATSASAAAAVERAIEKVKARRMRESDEGAEEEELAGDQRWFEGRVQGMGLDEATRRWRTRLPPGMRTLATYLNALRPERPVHALERRFPLLPAATAGGLPTLGPWTGLRPT